MFRNKTSGIVAAATLGLAAMLGATAAHAVKVCTDAPDNRDALTMMGGNCADSTTFALETLLEANEREASDSSDTTTYYDIDVDGIHLAAPADIGGGGDDYTVTVTLDGMVFQATPSLTVEPVGGTNFVVASGGAAGDAAVEFELSAGTVDATTGVFRLDADFAVSAGGGSATLTMANPSLQGRKSATHGPANVVMMAAALDEKAVAMNATADVAADGFMMFVDARTTASLGSLQVTVKENHRQASDGDDVDAQEDIMSITNNDATPPAPNSSVSFSGDFSFASKVFVHGDGDCGADTDDAHISEPNTDTGTAAAATDLRVMEGTGDDAMVTGTTSAVAVVTFAAAQHLCIMVDPEADTAMPIPTTDAYTAMGSYMGIEDAAIGPMPEEQTLGMIRRNGVTVRIPYVTTYSGYNQRIVVVNRGGGQARFEIEFMPEDGIMADPASVVGMLPAGTSMMLTRDIVTLSGGSRTAASVTVEAQAHLIDVATVTVNNSDGSTDTVTYTDNE